MIYDLRFLICDFTAERLFNIETSRLGKSIFQSLIPSFIHCKLTH